MTEGVGGSSACWDHCQPTLAPQSLKDSQGLYLFCISPVCPLVGDAGPSKHAHSDSKAVSAHGP